MLTKVSVPLLSVKGCMRSIGYIMKCQNFRIIQWLIELSNNWNQNCPEKPKAYESHRFSILMQNGDLYHEGYEDSAFLDTKSVSYFGSIVVHSAVLEAHRQGWHLAVCSSMAKIMVELPSVLSVPVPYQLLNMFIIFSLSRLTKVFYFRALLFPRGNGIHCGREVRPYIFAYWLNMLLLHFVRRHVCTYMLYMHVL